MKDAPYITEAMIHGTPHPKKIRCPKCGHYCETIYAIAMEALGCEYCVDVVDADVWEQEGGKEY